MGIEHVGRLIIMNGTSTAVEAEAAALAEIVFGRNSATGAIGYSVDDGATWTWLDEEYAPIGHVSDTDNPHEVTAEQVGLGTIVQDLIDHESDTNNPHDVTLNQVGDGLIAYDDPYILIGDTDGSDYIRIDAVTGTIRLLGEATSYKDLNRHLVGENLESPASDITIDPDENSMVFDDDCTLVDFVGMNIQMQHDWLLESDLHPHLHWWQASADVPNWLIQYRWQIQGSKKTTAWTNLPYVGHVFTYSAGTLNQITTFDPITPPEGAGLSDIVQFRVLRDTDNDSTEFDGADPLSGDVHAVDFDIHYLVDSFGSDEEYIADTSVILADDDDEYLTDDDGVILEE